MPSFPSNLPFPIPPSRAANGVPFLLPSGTGKNASAWDAKFGENRDVLGVPDPSHGMTDSEYDGNLARVSAQRSRSIGSAAPVEFRAEL